MPVSTTQTNPADAVSLFLTHSPHPLPPYLTRPQHSKGQTTACALPPTRQTRPFLALAPTDLMLLLLCQTMGKSLASVTDSFFSCSKRLTCSGVRSSCSSDERPPVLLTGMAESAWPSSILV